MARFVARLRLIKQGLVLAAVEVATMDVVILEDNDNEPQEEAMNTDDEEMDAERAKAAKTRTESEDDVIDRVNAFVTRTLQQDTIRSTEATTLINEERRRTIQEFFRKCVARLTCEKCRAQTIKLRKEGKSKIFEVPLSQKQLDKMAREGKQLHDILVTAVMEKRPTKTAQQDSEEDSSEEEEEEETQPIKMVKGTQQRQSSKLLTPLHIQQHLKVLFDKEQSLVDLLYARPTEQHANHNMFFIQVLAVSPTRFRPPAEQQGVLMENAQNVHLSKILGVCTRIRELNASESVNKDEVHTPADTRFEQLIVEWVKLQEHVNHYLDSEKGDGKLPPGIKQILEKKQGLFRMHMMGKRVNFAARSVISPDPNIETSEIGIPPVFAAKLTYPEPVTQYNIHEMRQAVINGAKWPGASHVQMENGELMSLNKLSLEQRTALANTLMTPTDLTLTQTPINKKVFRHLRNGDYLLLNRQPTLHKPSIMAHRARVLPGEKTIRLHYANCNTYNADFDGDEMNVHFPQNELGRAEAALIAATDYQYLVPTSGAPLRGLIQDHVVAGVWMTSRDTFFERDEMMQVVYGALQPENDATLGGGRLRILPPAMHKPKYLWTGKQIISILLLNMTWDHPPPNIVSKSQTPGRYWGKAAMEEAEVIVLNGELVQGVLDKAQFGAKAYGLVHSFYELYGPAMAGKLLSALGRLFTKFLQSRAFTCRMDDLRLTEQGDAWRRDLLHNGRAFGFNTAQDYVGLPSTAQVAPHHLSKEFTKRMEEVIREDEKMQGLDAAMKSKMNELTSSIIGKCLPDGLLIKFPDNNMQMMTVSGAKGSNVNVSQISCCLGQQELEGRRVPIMISGKSLPSFLPFDPTAKAGGFIASRFLTGVKPQEYFFHCMAGREGLIDTAVKTSRSGYLQRCLIKHLEGLRVHYDHTVRDADGSVLQFHYGEDALDVTKQKHLTQFAFVAQNFHIFNARLNPAAAAAVVDDEKAAEWNDLVKKEPDTHDPTMSLYSPSRYLRSTSESFQKALTQYTKNNPDDLLSVKKKPAKHNPSIQNLSGTKFRALMNLKYMQSLVEPGEAVGLLAAQGIGEPSTQMTLNTFHFAGFGAKNVTLGIPRLREIVMTASQSIKTPTMTLPLLSHVTQQDADALAKRMTKLTLAEVVDYVKVTERLAVEGGAGFKQYTVHLHFFPQQDYTDEYNIQPSDLEEVVERDFARKLYMMLTRELKMKLSARVVVDESNEGTDIGHAVKKTRTDGDGDSDVDSDADLPPRPGKPLLECLIGCSGCLGRRIRCGRRRPRITAGTADHG
jgi:DNA-directed RNA polymerase I subunit RPA1